MLICYFILFYFLVFDTINLLMFFTFMLFIILKMHPNYYDTMMFSDFLVTTLIFISLWVFIISLSSSNLSSTSLMLLWLMMISIFSSFLYFNGFLFYLFFEFSFIIMFLFLLSWGLMLERIQASFYMFFYTLVFSLPFLILILEQTLNLSMNYFLLSFSTKIDFLWVLMVLVFVVKLPLFSFHLWLPKAHVEAPVVGSMILAGVLLKLGGYGLIRFYSLIEFLSVKNNKIIIYLLLISVIGGILMNCVCLRQTDLKMLIAYSSIVHMSLVYLSVVSFSHTGHLGCVLMMLAHGFISPALFYLMSLIYSNSYTRSLYSLKGYFSLSPSFMLFWFVGCSLNFGFPPFMSFFSEVLITMSLSFLNHLSILVMILFFFLTGTYCIFMYISVSHGESSFNNPMKMNFLNNTFNSVLFFFVLLYPLMFFNL